MCMKARQLATVHSLLPYVNPGAQTQMVRLGESSCQSKPRFLWDCISFWAPKPRQVRCFSFLNLATAVALS